VGIFRAGAVAIVATVDPIVVEIAREKATKLKATLLAARPVILPRTERFGAGGRAITVMTPYARYEEVLVSLHGIHQGMNAATAIVAAEGFLGRALGEYVVSTTARQCAHAGAHGAAFSPPHDCR